MISRTIITACFLFVLAATPSVKAQTPQRLTLGDALRRAARDNLDLRAARDQLAVAGQIEAVYCEFTSHATRVMLYSQTLVPASHHLEEMAEDSYKSGKTNILGVVADGTICIRPILMTALATLFGPLPLALGAVAEHQKTLAFAVIDGLLLSTFVALLVMAVLYSLLEKRNVVA